jgi:tRNA threonylcarbamoyl adenosine modification protein YeaZ
MAMLILAVDTSTQAGSVAVLRDTSILGVVSTWVEETYSSRMFRHLDFLLCELRIEMKQFDVYAVAAGPGSFTGLRVGLTAVKGWAEVYEKRVAAVSGLEAIAAQAREPGRYLAPVMDARRGQIFGGLYERARERLIRAADEAVMTAAEFLEYLRAHAPTEGLAFVTPTPEVLVEPVENSRFRGRPIETVSAVRRPSSANWVARRRGAENWWTRCASTRITFDAPTRSCCGGGRS